MRTRFFNAYVITCNDKFDVYENGEVWVEDDKIVYVGKPKNGFMADRTINCLGDVLMPGFVNAHAHVPMQVLRGMAEESSFHGWWNAYIRPKEQKMRPDDIYWSTMLGIAELVHGGITSVLNNYFEQPSTVQAFLDGGIRAAVGVDVQYKVQDDLRYKDWENRFAALYKDSPLLTYFVTSHSIFSVNECGLNDCTRIAKKYKLPQTIHLCETLEEVGNCVKERNMTPVQYLEDIGFLDYPTTISHGVHVDKEDMDILYRTKTNVAINVSSNMKLASGIPPIYSYQQKGINLAIGTDSVASNNSLNMFREMFLVATTQKALLHDASVMPAKDVIMMATRGGAKALYIDDRVGQLKKGYQADIIRVSCNGIHWEPNNDKIANLIYSAHADDVVMTMIGGNIVFENGNYYIGESIERIIKMSREVAKRILDC